ncbi:MAG: tape measure protein [Planctomycetota bacterium]
MATRNENVNITLRDRIDPSINKKIRAIARSARRARRELTLVHQSMRGGSADAAVQINRLSLAQMKLERRLRATIRMLRRQNLQLRKLAVSTRRAKVATRGLNLENVALKRSLIGVAAFLVAGKVIELSDAYTTLNNRLKLVAVNSESVGLISQKVLAIARRSRTPVLEIATAYQRFDIALQELGASQVETLRFTETLSKAVIVAGLTGSEAANGIRQLTQAMNKGKLDGDEFRSVMENLPIVAKAIATEMKVTRGELLELAPQGKITSAILRAAMENAAEGIEVAFAKTTVTVEQAFTVIENSVTNAIGKFNEATGLSRAFAKGLLFLADNMKLVAIGIAGIVGAVGLPLLLAGLTALGPLIAGAGAATFVFIAIGGAIAAAVTALALFKDDIILIKEEGVTLGNVMTATWIAIKEAIKPAATTMLLMKLAINEVITSAKTLQDNFVTIMKVIEQVTFVVLRKVVALWSATKTTIINIWKNFPTIITNTFAKAAIGSLVVMQQFVKKMSDIAIAGVKIFDKTAAVILQLAASSVQRQIQNAIKTSGIVIAATSQQAGTNFGNNFKKALVDTKFESVIDPIIAKAKELAAVAKEAAESSARLRGEAPGEGTVLAPKATIPTGVGDDVVTKIQKKLEEAKKALISAETATTQASRAAVDARKQIWLDGTDAFLIAEATKTAALKRETLIRGEVDKLATKLAIEQQRARLANTNAALSASADATRDFALLIKNARDDDNKSARRAFKVAKAFALAKAVVNTAQGATEGVKLGFPAMIPAIAAAVAAGAVQIQTIQAQNFARGGEVRGPGGPRDDMVPANLSDKEFVVNAISAQNNMPLLRRINTTAGPVDVSQLAPQAAITPASAPNNSAVNRSIRASSGTQPIINLNIQTPPGTEAEVQSSQDGNTTQLDVIIRQVDAALASNLSRNRGALTEQIKARLARNF